MQTSRLRNECVALAMVVAFILYGSLYPFSFIAPSSNIGPVEALFATWNAAPQRGDVLANLIFYMPLGFVGTRAFLLVSGSSWGIAVAALAGAALSVGCELGQYYVMGRVTSATDVYSDVVGTILGGIVGIVFNRGWVLPRELRDQPFPALLLGSWLGYRLYPYVPVINLSKYWSALKPVIVDPQFTLYDFFRYSIMWLTVFALTDSIMGQKWSRIRYPLLVACVLFAKVMIISQSVTFQEILGAATAFFVWLAIWPQPPHRRALAVVLPLFAYVVAWRVAPFEFQFTGRSFGWSVFTSFLNGATDVNVESFLEKVFYYGSLVWLTTAAGLRIQFSACIVVVVLLITSGLEVFLPERSAEVTDAALALAVACLIGLMNRGATSSASVPVTHCTSEEGVAAENPEVADCEASLLSDLNGILAAK